MKLYPLTWQCSRKLPLPTLIQIVPIGHVPWSSLPVTINLSGKEEIKGTARISLKVRNPNGCQIFTVILRTLAPFVLRQINGSKEQG